MKKILSLIFMILVFMLLGISILNSYKISTAEIVDISSKLPYNIPSEIKCYDKYVMLKQCQYGTAGSYDMALTIYNKNNGRIHSQKHFYQTISDRSTIDFVSNGYIAVNDPDSMKITVYNIGFQKQYDFDYSHYNDRYTITALGKGGYFFSYDEAGCGVVITSMITGQEKCIKLKDACFGLYGADNDTAIASTESGYVVIDSSSYMKDIYVSNEFSIHGDRFFKIGNNSLMLSSFDDTDEITMLSIDNSEHMAMCMGNRIVTEMYGGGSSSLNIYDIASKRMINSYVMDSLGSSTVALGNDYAALCYTDGEFNTHVIIWNYLRNQKNLEAQVITSTRQELKTASAALSNNMYESHSVEVLYGPLSQAVCAGYRFQAEDDIFCVYNALSNIDRCLSNLPEGLIEEMKGQRAKGIKIQVVNGIYPASKQAISDASALTYVDNGYYYIILTSGSSVYSSLAHELMHIMFYRIEDYAAKGGEDFVALWKKQCTPKGFQYNGSYHTDEGKEYWNDEYTVDRGAKDQVWFIDAYSKTYVAEDFARTYEHLFDSEEELDSCFRYENIYKKAQYLSNILRQVFQSVERSDTVYWERLLEPIEAAVVKNEAP